MSDLRSVILKISGEEIFIDFIPGEGGQILSTLHTGCLLDQDRKHAPSLYDVVIDAVESLILAHAVAGVDVASTAYIQGLEVALEAIGNSL